MPRVTAEERAAATCPCCNEHLDGHDHPTLTEERFKARLHELLGEEAANEPRWWYLSFADTQTDGRFLGGLYLKARGPMHAALLSRDLGLNPGGEVLFFPVSDEQMETVPASDRLRLLSKEEVDPDA